ncbi:MAG: glycine-rich domain-containing protein [Fimbriimonadaceae bacterium]
MELHWKTLLDSLTAYDLDGGPTQLPFAERLAKEKRWTLPYAKRVIDEYRRFIFLAAVAKHPVTPSVAVDEAWHQHLTYTVSYRRMCETVIGHFIDHHPSRGGQAEDQKHHDQYLLTLQAYRDWFGMEAPADIWPRPKPAPVRRRLALSLPGAILPVGLMAASLDAIPPPMLVIVPLAVIVGGFCIWYLKRAGSIRGECYAGGCASGDCGGGKDGSGANGGASSCGGAGCGGGGGD